MQRKTEIKKEILEKLTIFIELKLGRVKALEFAIRYKGDKEVCREVFHLGKDYYAAFEEYI